MKISLLVFFMEKNCSFFGVGGILCGESRNSLKISSLFDCNENIQSHLSSCHLSKSNLKENELIAIRAGMFHLDQDNFKKMSSSSSQFGAILETIKIVPVSNPFGPRS